MAKPKRYLVSDGKLTLTLEVAEEGGYIVTSPNNPNVLTQAETLEEAFENARDVIALFKEDFKIRGKSRQPPRAKAEGRSLASSVHKTHKDHGVYLVHKPKLTKRPTPQQANPA